LPNTIKSIFKNHKGDYEATMGLVANAMSNTSNSIVATGDYDFIKSKGEIVRNVIQEQQQNVLIDYAMTSDEIMSAALSRGDFGGDYTDLFINLDDGGKAIVREGIRKQRDAKINDDKVTRDLALNDAKKNVHKNMVLMSTFEYQGASYNEAMSRLQSMSITFPEAVTPSQIVSLDSALDPTKTEQPNYIGEFQIRKEILSGQLTTAGDIENRAAELNVGAKQQIQILPLLATKDKEVESKVDKAARSFSKVVPGSDPTRDQSAAYYDFRRKVDARYQASLDEWTAGGEVGPRPSLIEVAEKFELESRQSVEQTNLDKEVAFLTQRFGPDGATPLNITITEYTTEAEIRQALIDAGYTGDKLNDLMRSVPALIYKIKEARDKRDALR
jgi:hypothetical protein